MIRALDLCPLSSRPAARAGLAGLAALTLPLAFASAATAQEQETNEALNAEPSTSSWGEHATGDWVGVRAALLRKGITIDVELLADHSANLSGGLQRGSVLRRPVYLALSFDTEPLLGWKGGRFHAGVQRHEGRHGSDLLVGDTQGFDNIDAPGFQQVSELWFEQSLASGRLTLRLGKLDANSDFAHVEGATEFLNSSAGFSPTILGFPTYPDPATGASLSLTPKPWFYAGAGAYDGATHEGCHGRTGNRGPSTLWGDPDALFWIGEAGLQWKLAGQLAGRVGAGTWRHTGVFERFEGGHDQGTGGSYVVFDQLVWRDGSTREGERALRAFAQLGWSDRQVSEIDRHVGLGLAWSGPFPGRNQDILGGMVSSAGFSDVPEAGHLRRCETAIEMFYEIRVRPWLGVKSDLQYITQPGGRGERPAFVWTVRTRVAL